MKAPSLSNNLKRLVYANYDSAKAYQVAKFYSQKFLHNLSAKPRETVVVYQMGKVGSSSVVRSLQALKNLDVYHIHGLTPYNIQRTENIYRQNFPRMRQIHAHLLESQYLRKQLDRGLSGTKRWKVITLVREPIARNVSSFFEVFESILGYDYKNKLKYMKTEDIVDELTELFIKEHIAYENEKSLNWFDFELKPVLDIDVYAHQFPTDQGYDIYQSDLVDLLLIRLENLNQCATEAFKKFLDIDEFSLLGDNIGSQKSYHSLYRQFLDSIILPKTYIDKMYTSKYMRHFYSEAELAKFKQKWCQRQGN